MMFSGFEFRAPPKNVRNINKRAEAVKNRPRKPNAAPRKEEDGQFCFHTQPAVTENGEKRTGQHCEGCDSSLPRVRNDENMPLALSTDAARQQYAGCFKRRGKKEAPGLPCGIKADIRSSRYYPGLYRVMI